MFGVPGRMFTFGRVIIAVDSKFAKLPMLVGESLQAVGVGWWSLEKAGHRIKTENTSRRARRRAAGDA